MGKRKSENNSQDPIVAFRILIARLIARRHVAVKADDSTQTTQANRKAVQKRKRKAGQ